MQAYHDLRSTGHHLHGAGPLMRSVGRIMTSVRPAVPGPGHVTTSLQHFMRRAAQARRTSAYLLTAPCADVTAGCSPPGALSLNSRQTPAIANLPSSWS